MSDIRLSAFALLQAIHEFDVAALREAISQRQERLRALGWKADVSDVDGWVPDLIASFQQQVELKGQSPNAPGAPQERGS